MAHGPVNTKFALSINASVVFGMKQSDYENVREMAQIIRIDRIGKIETKTAIVCTDSEKVESISCALVDDGYTTKNGRVFGKTHIVEGADYVE